MNQGYSKLAYLLFLAAALAGQMQAATQSTLSSPAAGAVLPATAQFVFPCVTGENQIEFRLGTGAASSQPFNIARAVMNVNRSCLVTTVPAMTPSATRVAESGSTITVTAAIPQNGAALTATLFSVINGTYPNKQYAFTEGKGTGAAPKVSTLTCATSTIPYEGTDSCTVTLSAAALPSTVVTLSSSSGNLVAPASVAVGTGAVSAAFSVTAAAVSVATAVTLTATLNGSVSTSLTLEPAVPVLQASASNIAFGNVYDGEAASGSVTLSSAGTAPVVISSVTPTGTGFGAIPLQAMTLAPGATETLTATFSPTVPGGVTGAVTVDSNAGVLTIGLSGTGVAVAAAYQVNLSWQEPPGSDAAASYVIERALVTFGIVGAYAAIGTATAPSYSDLDVTNGDEYSYQIVAVDAAGNQSAPSAAAVAAIP